MALPEHSVTFSAHLSAGLRAVRKRLRSSIVGPFGLILGCALAAPAVLAQSSPTLSGNWQLSCTGRKGQVRQVTLQIQQQGSKLSGNYSGGSRSGRLRGSVQGDEVSLELAGKRRSATLTGTTDGNTLQVHTPKGISCTATRQ